jgi:hypothetical protein
VRRHLIALAGAAGLLLFVAAGTWVLLNGASADVGTTWIALAGGGLAVAATVARGPESTRRLRILIGSIGLFAAVLAVALALLALAFGLDATFALVVAVVATVAYIQGAAAQSRLGFRVALPWILLAAAVATPTVVLGLLLGLVLGEVLGEVIGSPLTPRDLGVLGFGLSSAMAGLVLRAWSAGRPDRLAAPAAVARTAAGRPNVQDRVIIERGPRALFRSTAPTTVLEGDTR